MVTPELLVGDADPNNPLITIPPVIHWGDASYQVIGIRMELDTSRPQLYYLKEFYVTPKAHHIESIVCIVINREIKQGSLYFINGKDSIETAPFKYNPGNTEIVVKVIDNQKLDS